MRKLILLTLILVVAGLIAINCNGIELPAGPGNAGNPPPAAEMLPDLPGYKVVEGQQLTAYLGTLAEGEALLRESPNLAALLGRVDGIISCYEQAGAVRSRLYSNESFPLEAGAVAIGDQDQMLSPQNLFNCIGGSGKNVEAQSRGASIEPCSAAYSVDKDGHTFYVLYAGTTAEICQAFCSQLEGCPATR